jgi:hypothetical protein
LSAAAGLLAQLRKSLEDPAADDGGASNTARFRQKVKAAISRGLWPEDSNPLAPLDDAAGGEVKVILPVAPESARQQWEWVVQLGFR